ncbi:MAG: dienelactone hydrolase family protein, partial [Deltaproteobacteria bacterium]|nr:dienelactone hydrolase family protein [Nannocystaceae bacterium]
HADAPDTPAATHAAPPRGRMVTILTKDGAAEAFFVAPPGDRHPGVLLWPDVAGLRDAFTTMATRLATQGYAVLAVNPYYRSAKLPVLESFEQWRTPEGKAKITPLREALTADAITRDGAAFVAWLDRQTEVDTARKIATTGYCMGGPLTLRTAAAVPDRVGLVGSFHGAGLVTDATDSPHLLAGKMKAAALVCIAENDDARQPDAKTALKQTAEAAQLPAEIEVYPAQHGWCVTDSPVYDEAQAERAWSRLLAMLAKHV